MSRNPFEHPLLVVVGAGGVGKTTLAAALGAASAQAGADTLVMTFDPSARLKDALGVGETARDREVRVALTGGGRLDASLLDAAATFDRLVRRYAPDDAAAARIFGNRFYHHLAGSLAGILEYMAVERLFEVAEEGRYRRVILDTPPTRQALDFLEAPERIVNFLDSGALKVALKNWFDADGRLATRAGRVVSRGIEALLDRTVGLELLREMAEFFQAFGPLFGGFRSRALEVRALLKRRGTRFVLVTAPGEERTADTLYFARLLVERGHHLGPIILNQVHPAVARVPASGAWREGLALLAHFGARDHRAAAELAGLLRGESLVTLPLLPEPPADLAGLAALGRLAAARGYRTAAS